MSRRLIATALLAVSAAACSADLSTAPVAGAAPMLAKTPAPVPSPNLAGHWVESPKLHSMLPDGTAQEVWYEFDATQVGSTLQGTARRYVSYWDVAGNPIVVRRDLGAPGKLTGSISGNTVSIGFLKITEQKLNLGYQTTLSADLTTLTVINPTPFGVRGFVR